MKILPNTLASFFWHFIKRYKISIFFVQLFCLSWAFESTVQPYILKLFIDAIVGLRDVDKAQMWSVVLIPFLLFIGFFITNKLLYKGYDFLWAVTAPKLEASVRMYIFEYVEQHSYQYFSDTRAGSIANRISDMSQGFTRLLDLLIGLFIPALLAVIIAVSVFATLQPYFSIILIGWIVLHMSISFYFGRTCNKLAFEHAQANAELSGRIVDSIVNFTTVKLFARRGFEYSYIESYQRDEQSKHKAAKWYIAKLQLVLGIIAFLFPISLLTWLTLITWQQGLLSIGEVVFILYATANIINIVWWAGMQLPNFFREVGICNQALSLIKTPHQIKDVTNAPEIKITKGEIEFDNVSFHYQHGQKIFQNKSLVVKKGEKVGLVGFSGAGKSTFVNLILRLFDLEDGKILIDKQNVAQVTQDSLRSQISVIPQEPILFHRTIMENIRYGDINATDDDVIVAAKKAHCHEFIEKLPQAYQTTVGERGIKLSGGQRQRIAIARAVLKKAAILIFDEATSALDSKTERHIQESMHYLVNNHTTIVIAHRLSTLTQMDRILVFKEGKIVEDGNHQQLLAANSHYAYLWSIQVEGFLPSDE